jgi:uncharacterized Zn finger protein (UPF0148 family)
VGTRIECVCPICGLRVPLTERNSADPGASKMARHASFDPDYDCTGSEKTRREAFEWLMATEADSAI